ncbi:uncharacterized protein LOC134705498 [Mytilus trossulus]|uniref:uncharacterized protein LOC134705498 n=1 Tax=Mytilus trossulus TaxID=6551 RepID=UPI0030072097
MALFGAQMSIGCTLCERGNSLKWKCLTCKELLCDDCNVYHKKLRATKDHVVIHIKELNEDKLFQAEVITCRDHDDACRLFCMDCKFPICTTKCIKLHDGHHFETIENLRRTLEKSTKKLIDDIEIKTKSYATLCEIEDCEGQRIKKELSDRKQCLTSIIESKYGKLKTDLCNIYQNSNKQLQSVNDNQLAKELREKQSLLEDVMKIHDIEELVKKFNILKKEVGSLSQQIPDLKRMYFQPGHLDIHFGALNINSKCIQIRDISSLHHIEIVRKIKTDLEDVDMICLNSNDTTWIGGQNDARVQLIRNSSGRLINQIKTNFSNGCVISDKLYMCSLNEKSISIVSLDGAVFQMKDMQPLYPLCIYVTCNKDIVIGATDELDNYELNKTSRRVVMTINEKGEVKKELTVDAKGDQLFVKPYRCMVNEQTNDLVVLDRTSGGSGRIVGISVDDDVKFRYYGRSSDELTCEFNPTGLVFAYNNIIVCDYSNHALDIIDSEGKMLKCINIEINGVSSLCVDSLGQLWIGNRSKKTKAELFITTLK